MIRSLNIRSVLEKAQVRSQLEGKGYREVNINASGDKKVFIDDKNKLFYFADEKQRLPDSEGMVKAKLECAPGSTLFPAAFTKKAPDTFEDLIERRDSLKRDLENLERKIKVQKAEKDLRSNRIAVDREGREYEVVAVKQPTLFSDTYETNFVVLKEYGSTPNGEIIYVKRLMTGLTLK